MRANGKISQRLLPSLARAGAKEHEEVGLYWSPQPQQLLHITFATGCLLEYAHRLRKSYGCTRSASSSTATPLRFFSVLFVLYLITFFCYSQYLSLLPHSMCVDLGSKAFNYLCDNEWNVAKPTMHYSTHEHSSPPCALAVSVAWLIMTCHGIARADEYWSMWNCTAFRLRIQQITREKGALLLAPPTGVWMNSWYTGH